MAERQGERGDKFETHIGTVSGPVHTGQGDLLVDHWDAAHGVSQAEIAHLRGLFENLRAQAAAEAPTELEEEAQAQVDALEKAVISDEPDVNAMKRVRDWFVEQLPSAAGAVTSLLVNPILGKLVETTGELAADELKRLLGVNVEKS